MWKLKSLLRRLAGLVYDLLLLLAVLFVATALILPLNGGHAFNSAQWAYPVYLGLVSFAFVGWFWTHGGQTLGMRAWKIRAVGIAGQPLDWRQALIRSFFAMLSAAVFGLGFLWMLVDSRRRCWQLPMVMCSGSRRGKWG